MRTCFAPSHRALIPSKFQLPTGSALPHPFLPIAAASGDQFERHRIGNGWLKLHDIGRAHHSFLQTRCFLHRPVGIGWISSVSTYDSRIGAERGEGDKASWRARTYAISHVSLEFPLTLPPRRVCNVLQVNVCSPLLYKHETTPSSHPHRFSGCFLSRASFQSFLRFTDPRKMQLIMHRPVSVARMLFGNAGFVVPELMHLREKSTKHSENLNQASDCTVSASGTKRDKGWCALLLWGLVGA